jgi:hypothetical protein
MLFAGGRSKYVCVYDVAEKVLLRRFQVSCACASWFSGVCVYDVCAAPWWIVEFQVFELRRSVCAGDITNRKQASKQGHSQVLQEPSSSAMAANTAMWLVAQQGRTTSACAHQLQCSNIVS